MLLQWTDAVIRDMIVKQCDQKYYYSEQMLRSRIWRWSSVIRDSVVSRHCDQGYDGEAGIMWWAHFVIREIVLGAFLLLECLLGLGIIIGGSCHKYHFCHYKRFCCDKHVFVMTKHIFCHDKTILLQKIWFCHNKRFGTANILLLRKRPVLSWQLLLWQDFCHDKYGTCGTSCQW